MDPSNLRNFNWRLETPACIMVSGASGCGKSWLTRDLLKRADEIFDKPTNRILWCYTEHQTNLMKELQQSIPHIEFHKGLPEEIDNPDPTQHQILILDDLLHECKKKNMQAMFVRGSHHQNTTVIYLTQNAFEPGQRTISLQCKYCVLMKNPRDSAHYQHLGRQMNGGRNCPVLETAYQECAKRPHGYILLDYGQNQDDNFRIRSSFFPEEMTIYSKKN